MTTRKTLLLSLIALVIAAPGVASASSFFHDVGGEIGVTTHPDHINNSLSRADVNGSVLEARKNGTLAILQRGGVLPSKAVSPSKTREQVQQEYLTMSAAEKQRVTELYGVGN